MLIVLALRIVISSCFRYHPNMITQFDGKITRKFKKWLLMPPTFKSKHLRLQRFGIFLFSIPTRTESLIILGYHIIHFLLLLVDYHYIYPSEALPSRSLQMCKYLGERSGILAVGQMPLVFLFATRSNILVYYTGWQQETFRVFHNWISKGIVVDIVIHVVTFAIMSSKIASYGGQWNLSYLRWGSLAAASFVILVFQSMTSIRLRWKQVFHFIHCILAIIVVIGTWWHLKSLGEMTYLYVSVALWVVDRLMRIYSILRSGALCRGVAQLHVGGVMELTINYSNYWKWGPGSWAHVHIAKWNTIWQSKKFYLSEVPGFEGQGKIRMFSQAQNSITKSAWNYLRRHPHACAEVKVLIDGPYKVCYPLHNYQTIVLIAGGLGVSTAYGYATDIKRRFGCRRKVIFTWLIADESPLTWFREELQTLRSFGECEVQIYVNKYFLELDLEDGYFEKSDIRPVSLMSFSNSFDSVLPLNVSYERPSIERVVKQCVSNTCGTTAFLACGPCILNDEVRCAVAENVERANSVIDYYEEPYRSER
jgi:NAD(P)H-flavin reductase